MLKYLRSRTVALNVACAVLIALLEALPAWLPALEGVLPPTVYPWVLVAVNLVNVALRAVTTQPLQERANAGPAR